METFRHQLKQEFLKRAAKNEKYSLRAFAAMLGINHATLSGMLAGKRSLTKLSAVKIASKLGWGPEMLAELVTTASSAKSDETESPTYFLLQQDAFAAMSDWYFDAVLEFTKIPGAKLEPKIISNAFGISELQARLALETLERLELLKVGKDGRYRLLANCTTNILDPDFTTAAQRAYQLQILRKSVEALENISPAKRDHTSTTIAIGKNDLPEAKKMIAKFRHKLDRFLQRESAVPDEVYQLQVSFFPLSQNN